MNNFGEYIKEKREKLRISQRELARRIKVDNKTINNIEKNKIKKINFNIIINLSNILKIDLFEIAKMAQYTEKEIKENIINNFFNRINLFNEMLIYSNLGEKINYEKYLFKEDNENYLDIEKILNGYKNEELSLKETIVLINACNTIDDYEKNKIIYPTENGNIDIDIY